LRGIADEFAEALHVAEVPLADIRQGPQSCPTARKSDQGGPREGGKMHLSSFDSGYIERLPSSPTGWVKADLDLTPRFKEASMDWDRVQGSWKQLEGKIKAKWGKLTADDLTAINGRREQLEGKLQQRYGLAKDQVRKEIDDWFTSQGF
jgi:uncharacterized protein YjbJ (UPF0337 family)